MKIVIATDLSVESHFAVRWALQLRDRMREKERPVQCFLIHVPSPSAPFAYRSLAGYAKASEDPDVHRRLVHRVRTFLESVDRNTEDVEIIVEDGDAAALIARFCSAHDVDWLVAGRSSLGAIGRLMLRSTVHQLTDLVDCKLAVIHPDHPRLDNGSLDFVVGVDFLPGSEAALLSASELAEDLDANLHIIHALQDAPTGATQSGLVNYLTTTDVAYLAADARHSLEAMMEQIQHRHPALHFSILVHSGPARQVLLEFIDEHDADALFVGKILHSRLEKWALGSVARGLLKRMPTTMILVPPDGY